MYPNYMNNPYIFNQTLPYTNISRIPYTTMPIYNNKINILSKLNNGFKAINWSNIINNTSKTLNVINQAIPVIKQTGPMLHNMRSMLKIASVFKEETSNKYNNNNNNNNNINDNKNKNNKNNNINDNKNKNKNNNNNNNNNNINDNKNKKEDKDYTSLPNFFV